jgi:phosphoglycolate phosphatase
LREGYIRTRVPYDTYDAVVYDMDGTLVELDVDWATVEESVAAVYEEAGVDPDGRSLWEFLEDAREHDLFEPVNAAIAEYEREGARRSSRLPLADEPESIARPIGVCSLNCSGACEIALERHGLADHVSAVIGRDSVGTWKPDPEPLLATVDALGVDPADAVFVGDSARDKLTAERAGTGFVFYEPSH